MQPTYISAAPVTVQSAGVRTDRTCFLLRQVLSAEECLQTISTITAAGFQPMGVDYPRGYRDNDRAVLDDAELAARLFARIRPHLPAHLVAPDGSTWRLSGLNERFRFCRYTGGQSFCIHRDGAFSREAGERSLLTCMVYLNDAIEFTGGATRYYAAQDPRAGLLGSVAPVAGTMIVFDHDLWHDGEAVAEGVKYVMRTDVLYVREQEIEAVPSSPGCEELRGHDGYVWSLLRRRDGRLVSASRDRTIRHWAWGDRSRAWREVSFWERHEPAALALAEDRKGRLWRGSRDGIVQVSVDELGSTMGGHAGAVLSLAVLADQRVASASADGTIRIWSVSGHGEGRLRSHEGWVWSLALLRPDLLASGGDDGVVRLWNPMTGKLVAAVELGRGGVRSLAAVSSKLLACGCGDGCVIHVRVAAEGVTTRKVAQVHTGPVLALARLDSGGLASAGEDGRVHLLDGDLSPRQTFLHGNFVPALAALPGGRLATGCYDGVVRVWTPAGHNASVEAGAPPRDPPTIEA